MLGIQILFLSILAIPPAQANDLVAQAEKVRLSLEMERLGKRQAWNGVEQMYQKTLDLGVVPSTSSLLLGAEAAQELGDMEACQDRLRRVKGDKATQEVIDWRWGIDNSYGQVEISTRRGRNAILTRSIPLLSPRELRAFEAVVDQAAQNGEFSGLLPAGQYTYAGKIFTVLPGGNVSVQVSGRDAKTARKNPPISDPVQDLAPRSEVDEEPYSRVSLPVRDEDGRTPW
jgi:hypothetical protein